MDPLTWGAIGAGASLAGAWLGGNANEKAAEANRAAQMQAAQVQADALERAKGDVTRYGEQAKTEYGDIAATGAPGTDYLRRAVGESGELTPMQRQQLAEIQRKQTNQIRTSAIAGSGRTAASLFRDTSNDFVNRSLENNRNRAFGAAGTLNNQSYGAGMARAGVTRGMGSDIAGLTSKVGAVQGDAYRNIGATDAAAGLATGKLYGSAVGDVGSYIAGQGRPSRYSGLRDDTSRADTGYYSYGAGGVR